MRIHSRTNGRKEIGDHTRFAIKKGSLQARATPSRLDLSMYKHQQRLQSGGMKSEILSLAFWAMHSAIQVILLISCSFNFNQA